MCVPSICVIILEPTSTEVLEAQFIPDFQRGVERVKASTLVLTV